MYSRLITADQDTVEIAHEAVYRAWPRLQAWLDEDRDGLRIRQHLAQAAREWDRSGRDQSELYRGARLVAATDLADHGSTDLNELERTFLTAGITRRDAEQNETRRRIHRLRTAVAGIGVLLVLTLLAGLLAVVSDRQARRQRDMAVAAQQNALLEALVSRSLASRSTNRALAALLAVEAYRRRPDARSWSALLSTFTGSPGFIGYRYVPAERFVTGALVPHTSLAVVALDGHQLALIDLDTGALDRRFPPPSSAEALDHAVVRISSDGRYVAQLTEVHAEPPANALSVDEMATGHRVLGPLRLPFYAGDIAINADGSLVAVAGGSTGELAVYRVADGVLVGRLGGLGRVDNINLTHNTAAVNFGPDGRIYLGSMRGTIRAVDPSTFQTVTTFDAPALSSHNQVIADTTEVIAAGDEAAVAIELSTGTVKWTIRRNTGTNACSVIAIATNSSRFYCRNLFALQAQGNFGRVGRLEERDLRTGLPTGTVLDPQQDTIGDISITSDGRELVTFSYNAPIISRWRLDRTGPATTRVGHGRIGANYDPTGKVLLVSHQPDAPRFQDERQGADDWYLWDPNTNQMIDPLNGITGAAWGPAGELAAVFSDRTGGFYNLATHTRIPGPKLEIDGQITSRFQSLDGRRLYVGFADGRVKAIDAATRQWTQPTIQLDGQIGTLSATGDGSRIIVTFFKDGEWRMTVHDGTGGQQIGQALAARNTAQVAPDGTPVSSNLLGELTQHDLNTLAPIGAFPSVQGPVVAGGLRFSNDSKILTATDGRNVSIYDVASRIRVGDPIPVNAFTPRGTSLRPDGKAIAIGDGDGDGIAIWDLDPDHLRAAACRVAGRNLTPIEWDSHLHGLGEFRATCAQYP